MWHSGIDQHKQFCVITTYGAEGPRVKQARVASTPLELARYFAEFPGPHRAAVESSGGWYWLANTLAGLGVELVLAHAGQAARACGRMEKIDRRKAASWARRQGQLRPLDSVLLNGVRRQAGPVGYDR
jgi:hypothetical protein